MINQRKNLGLPTDLLGNGDSEQGKTTALKGSFSFTKQSLLVFVGIALIVCIFSFKTTSSFLTAPSMHHIDDTKTMLRSSSTTKDADAPLSQRSLSVKSYPVEVPPEPSTTSHDIPFISLVPPALWTLDHDQLWDYYHCDGYLARGAAFERPDDHTPIWEAMRKVYVRVMGPKEDPGVQERLLREQTAMQVAYTVRKVPGKGLGLFAKSRIKQGDVIYDGNHGGHVHFHSGHDFRHYIHTLPDNYMQCLVLQCSAVESLSKEDPRSAAYLALDMDDGCFANAADDDEVPNVDSTHHEDDCNDLCDYARRDIRKGEEMLWSYGEYVYPWSWFNL